MENKIIKDVIEQIRGSQLTDIKLACEMMVFHIERYALHAQCLTRIIKDGDILVTTADYQSWDGETSENNDEWHNLDKYRSEIIGGKVISISLNALGDVEIALDNGIIIQIYVENGYPYYDGEQEQYRFFEIGPDNETEEQEKYRKHYVVYGKHIEIV